MIQFCTSVFVSIFNQVLLTLYVFSYLYSLDIFFLVWFFTFLVIVDVWVIRGRLKICESGLPTLLFLGRLCIDARWQGFQCTLEMWHVFNLFVVSWVYCHYITCWKWQTCSLLNSFTYVERNEIQIILLKISGYVTIFLTQTWFH